MEEFLLAIENHPKACAFLVLLAVLTCTFRFHWIVGKDVEEYAQENKSKQ